MHTSFELKEVVPHVCVIILMFHLWDSKHFYLVWWSITGQ